MNQQIEKTPVELFENSPLLLSEIWWKFSPKLLDFSRKWWIFGLRGLVSERPITSGSTLKREPLFASFWVSWISKLDIGNLVRFYLNRASQFVSRFELCPLTELFNFSKIPHRIIQFFRVCDFSHFLVVYSLMLNYK